MASGGVSVTSFSYLICARLTSVGNAQQIDQATKSAW